MRGRTLVIVAAGLVLAALGGWWFGSPWWTLKQMREAAAAKDSARLSAYVDYPALRADLKDDLSRRLLGTGRVRAGSVEGLVAATIAGPLIDAMVTPQGVQAMFEADEIAGPRRTSSSGSAGRLPRVPAAKDQPMIDRDGLNQFRVRGREPGSPALVFRRYGLGWKLAGVDLARASGSGNGG